MNVKRQLPKQLFFSATVILMLCMSLVTRCPAQATDQGAHEKEESVRKFLQAYDSNPSSPSASTTRYVAAFVDLKDDGTQEAIVYLIGSRWCGSGGCSSLILAPEGSSFKVITKTTVTRLPIRILSTKTNGWHDLAVSVGGGGIRTPFEARLRFNGKKYPSNPTAPPSQKLTKKTEGKVVIPSSAKALPLYD